MQVVFFFFFLIFLFFFFKQKTAYEIKECDWSSDVCSSDLIARASLREAGAGSFVKPTLTKQFDAIQGFDPSKSPSGINLDTECWISEPVRFHEEYRVYVLNREAIGIAQYDLDSLDRELLPEDTDRIDRMVAAWEEQPVAWALDVGRADGFKDLLLVETNDGWATGYYPAAMSPGAYAEWLLARWQEILSEAHTDRKSVV